MLQMEEKQHILNKKCNICAKTLKSTVKQQTKLLLIAENIDKAKRFFSRGF